MLKKCSIPSAETIVPGELHERRVGERDEVHREPGAHPFAHLGVTEDDLAAVGDPVDRALGTRGELHHEQIGVGRLREELEAPP